MDSSGMKEMVATRIFLELEVFLAEVRNLKDLEDKVETFISLWKTQIPLKKAFG